MADNYPKDPGFDTTFQNQENSEVIKLKADYGTFPYPEHLQRINYYKYYEKLFIGDHFGAFSYHINDEQYNKQYSRLRYVVANFAGLLSKVIADFLFSEPIAIKVPDGDQEFMDALWQSNKMDVQLYESALGNSFYGDSLFKLRSADNKLYIDEVAPTIYYPKVDSFNVRKRPDEQELAWLLKINKDTYLRKEIHKPGMIVNELWQMKGNEIVSQVDIGLLGIEGLQEQVPTKVDFTLLYHTPNWKTGNRYFGISDYHDLDSLFYAINNRLSMIDNILDKHSDPILMVPPGVLDEKGNVNKKALGVVEIGEGESGKPEYIVWDASLENAFKEVEKLVETLLMTSEISPDVFGMGEGQSDSGRALKYKMLRTIAKAARKRIYYDYLLKELLYDAQVFAKKHSLTVDGLKLQGEPTKVEIEWHDGIPDDETEVLENERIALDLDITSQKASIMRVYGVDETSADEIIKTIKEEQKSVTVPQMNLGFNKKELEDEDE